MARKPSEILFREHLEAKKILAELDALVGIPSGAAHCRNGSARISKENDMTISATKTVRELAVEVPGATRVFEKLGIDYCCGGSAPLEEACSKAKVPISQVVESLEKAAAESAEGVAPEAGPANADWKTEPLSRLTGHVVATHHAFTRSELARLDQLLAKVCKVHGQNHPELLDINRQFQGLQQELTMHMMKEERILFPYIEELEAAVTRKQPKPAPPFGTVQNPIRMMMTEHDSAGEALKQIRGLSSNFTPPADACISYQTLYQALLGFEADLHQHIHLENNILFPRAVGME
jgi:regulator of cell morphogenesis and NO signaling